MSPKKVETQFNDNLKILDEGSKIENSLVIIFKFFGTHAFSKHKT